MKMSVEERWSDNEGGKATYSEKILSHCHFAKITFIMDTNPIRSAQ
jgi:hypothetical protein